MIRIYIFTLIIIEIQTNAKILKLLNIKISKARSALRYSTYT